ncbi:enoyl-CoA hydratase/isomerase family protein [Pseudomaricurvus alkylphenolicus]|uniref:enoyl-CoA hydratase/isomerase family protein n=1 Tax=Pseudomaricurvus alkylphenolicus TaxID=1306991 RepID=UPI0014202D33|nr:enoyl-CoA hydratase-related protein [Pseudomaricurvus alkylphenolicus]NIB42185.1 enoyl-CoA hydratase/isomerase family protein [Pseudomaricurvus alkylphenolicus]
MSSVSSKLKDGVYRVTLNRPEQRNALNLETVGQLSECLDVVETNQDIRCLVITGAGSGFCAGADVAEWAQAEARGELETYGWTEATHALMAKLSALSKPTVAAINGSAVGAGLDLALNCDFRYAVAHAKFKPGYTGMAYCPDAGASWHLPRLIGIAAAKQFLFFDKAWTANQALQAGMVTAVLEEDEWEDELAHVAQTLASGPTFAFGQTKQLLLQSARSSLPDHLALEQQAGLLCGRTEDAAEALRAISEKRTPIFMGR